MKILQVCFNNPTKSLGGVETVVYELSKNLKQMGNDVDILCADNEEYINDSTIGKIISIKTSNFNFFGSKGGLIKKIIYNRKIKKFINENGKNYTAIHLHGDVGGSKIFKKYNTIITFHGFTAANPKYKNIFIKIFLYFFSSRYEFKNLKYCKKFVAVSKTVRKQIKKYSDRKIEVIYNGIDLKKFTVPTKNNKYLLRKKLNLEDNKKFAMFVGTQRYIKGLDIAIETMKLLNSNKVKLNVIGIEDKSKIPNINFLGRLEKSKIIDYYKASDIFIMPSRYEGFAIAALEAMACGLPVIIPDNIGFSEIIQNKINGLKIKNTPENFALGIKTILNNKELLKSILKNNKKIIKKFDWKLITNKYIEIYRN